MARLGSARHPAIARVQTHARAHEIVTLCNRHSWKVIVGVEPDKPEDIGDIPELLRTARPARDSALPSRNAVCPCGSGRKYKRCCGKA